MDVDCEGVNGQSQSADMGSEVLVVPFVQESMTGRGQA